MSHPELPSQLSDPAREILHATDFTKESEVALAHALRLALTNKATLHLLHVTEDENDETEDFPSIRRILERWGTIPAGAPRSAVTDLGIGVKKVVGFASNVVDSIAAYCHRHPVDMLVLATAGRDGLAAWLRPSRAERVAEQVSIHSIPTLFVPARGRSSIDVDSGAVSMEQVLAPVDHSPKSESAVERGLRAIALYGTQNAQLTLLHIGAESQFPEVHIPAGPWKIQRSVRKGNAAAEIVAAAEESQANLIIMVTEGTDGFLDVLRGTTTAQVLRQASCPVLAIPAQP